MSESIWTTHKPAGSGGAYLKLKNGDKKLVRFYSSPAVVTYDGVKLRYQVVLFNKTDKLAQIFEFGAQIFGQLGDLYEEWGEPNEMDITIKRTGSTQFDTEYAVNPVPKSVDLTKEEIEACDMVKFPTGKSKMLHEYEQDHVMPETIETKQQNTLPDDPVGEDEPINPEDIPF